MSRYCARATVLAYGVGYFPATNDYRFFVASADSLSVDKDKAAIFSSRAHAWETLEEVDSDEFSFVSDQGILLKEALHWVDNREDQILAFDLGQEETHKFRKMLLPRDFSDDGGYNYENHLGVSAGGCLSLAHNLRASLDYIDVWVMGEYGVRDSWTKLFNLKLLDPPKDVRWYYNHVLVLETSMVTQIYVGERRKVKVGLIKIVQKEEDKCSRESYYKVNREWITMIDYQESLLWIED
uniref:F-box protein CPR30-like isoform X2 n=1 Tax=Fragaria vesca subsp. vesca TaxID=101020 RepID=UPI0005C876C4|nr:PREDICTED: F-box protein CPR30-like isoform X2 [Fragaria vesca subsp. vesca]